MAPKTFRLGNRVYEILPYLRGKEQCVDGTTVAERARKMQTSSGKEDCIYIWKNRQEIPAEFQEKIIFVFPDWSFCDKNKGRCMVCIIWFGEKWNKMRAYGWLAKVWHSNGRLVRRQTA